MSLTRKVRRVGSSLMVTFPSHIAQAFDIEEGDMLEYTIIDNTKFMVEKKQTGEIKGKVK